MSAKTTPTGRLFSADSPDSQAYELAVVVPVFNEEKNIGELLLDWQNLFRSIPVRHRFLIVDDGSTDNSLSILQSLSTRIPGIEIHTQTNAGHGPAILAGYKKALGMDHSIIEEITAVSGRPTAEWIFQIDSDHQHDPSVFATLWKNRHEFDFLLGERTDKNASLARKFVSLVSKLIVRLFYGARVKDVNSPYRLMRSSGLKEVLPRIPRNTFAPNILLTAWFVFFQARIFTTALGNRSEAIQRQSKMNGYFLRGCFQSIFQTILFRFRL